MGLRLLLAIIFTAVVISSSFAQSLSTATAVTASEYAHFLNQKAVTDAQHFYNDAMGSDPQTACIARVSTSGNFHYDVIAGRGNFPVPYVNEVAKQAFLNWSQNIQLGDEQKTPISHLLSPISYLASNQTDLCIMGNDASLSLTVPSLGKYSYSQWSGTEHAVFWAAFGIAVGALGEHIRGKMFDPVAGGVDASSLPRDALLFKMHEVNELNAEIGNAEGESRAVKQQIVNLENQELTQKDTGQLNDASVTHAELERLKAKDAQADAEIEQLRQLAMEKENAITGHLETISQQQEQLKSHTRVNHEERKARMHVFGEKYKDKKIYHDLFADLENPDLPIYTEVDLLEKSIEQNILEGSRSLIESQKYFAEEKRTHKLDEQEKYHVGEITSVSKLEAIVKEQMAALASLKAFLLNAREVKQQAYFYGEKAATYFPSEKTKQVLFETSNEALKTAKAHFASVITDINGHETMTEKASVDDHSVDHTSDSKSVAARAVAGWQSFVGKAKSIVDDDQTARENRKSLSSKDAKEKKAKALEHVHLSIVSLFNDTQGKRDSAAEKAEATLSKETAALSRFSQVKNLVEEKHAALASTFKEATVELSESWILLHGVEEQFHSAAWLKLFGEADTGRINSGTEKILGKLGLLLDQARDGADRAMADFDSMMVAIQEDLHAPTLTEIEKADDKVQKAAAVIKKDRSSMEADMALMQQVKTLLKNAQDQADIILGEMVGDEKTAREQFQNTMQALLQRLANHSNF